MRLEFDQHGNYDFQIPELNIVAWLQVPPTVAIPVAEPVGMDVVLTAGEGIRHGSTLVDVKRLYGVSPRKIQSGFLAYPKQGIYFYLDAQERVKKIVVGAAR